MSCLLLLSDVQEKMEQFAAESGSVSINKLTNFIKAEQQKWAVVAKASGIKLDA